MKKFSKILVGLLVVVCIVEGFFLYRAYAIPSTTLQTARKINRIEQIIDKYAKFLDTTAATYQDMEQKLNQHADSFR